VTGRLTLYLSILTATAQHLQAKPIDWRKRRECNNNLGGKDWERTSWSLRQSLECEDHYDRQLSSHQELPNVGGCSLVSFTGYTEYSDVQEHCNEGGGGHSNGHPGGGLF
jgi:hypothetical protein